MEDDLYWKMTSKYEKLNISTDQIFLKFLCVVGVDLLGSNSQRKGQRQSLRWGEGLVKPKKGVHFSQVLIRKLFVEMRELL